MATTNKKPDTTPQNPQQPSQQPTPQPQEQHTFPGPELEQRYTDYNNDGTMYALDKFHNRVNQLRQFSTDQADQPQPVSHPWNDFLADKYTQSLVETPEQQQKREKRERTERQITAIADGLVALSNVAGAMGGATPYKQTSLTQQQQAAVARAAAARAENAKLYQLARKQALEAQTKSDEQLQKQRLDYARRQDAAGKQADVIDLGIAKLMRQQKASEAQALQGAARINEQRRHNQAAEQLDKARIGEAARHNRAAEGNQRQANNIRAVGANLKLKDAREFDEFARWSRLFPQTVENLRKQYGETGGGDGLFQSDNKTPTLSSVKLFNAKMREAKGNIDQYKTYSELGITPPSKSAPKPAQGKTGTPKKVQYYKPK